MGVDDQMLKAVFQSFSRGMDQPSFGDFEAGVRGLNVDFSTDTLRHVFEKHDRNKDGRLSFAEFKSLAGMYPKLADCLHYRLCDRRALDVHEEGVAVAEDALEGARTQRASRIQDLEDSTARLAAAEDALQRQMQALEEERAREASARVADEAERLDQVSSRQANQVASALDKAAKGVCAEKAEQFYASVSEEDIQAFAARLAEEYRRKDGDIVDELVANIKVPETVHSKLAVVAEAAQHLQTTRGEHYPGHNRIELLVMALYTMAGPDIDALMTYENVPVYDEEDTAPWEAYTAQYSKERNGAVFSAINWAMRTAADPKKTDTDEGKEAWATCAKWVKYIALLVSICVQVEREQGATLARGLAGLPTEIVEAHRSLYPQELVSWPSASSCAFDREVSESYIRGDAANAVKRAGGSILFLLRDARWGVSLQSISKYPKEAEMLLPPFAKFTVDSHGADPTLPDTLLLNMAMGGHNAPADWVRQVANDSEHSSKRLQTALVAHAENSLRDRQAELERQRQRERQSGGDVLRTERDVERQRGRLSTAEADAKRAEDRLAELEKLLEEQRAECTRQQHTVERNTQELHDAEGLREAALVDQQEARRSVAAAEEVVQQASSALDDVKRAKDERRRETQQRLQSARRDTGAQERAKQEAEGDLARNKLAVQQAKADLDAAGAELSDAERRLAQMREAAEAAARRRAALDEEEGPILDTEVKLVLQRCALSEKESKHFEDVRSFDEQFRPLSPQQERGGGGVVGRGVTASASVAPSGRPTHDDGGIASPAHRVYSAATPLPPPGHADFGGGAPQHQQQQQHRQAPPTETSFEVHLTDENDAVGLYWEGNDDGGIFVKTVTHGGAAWRAGIREGYRLLRVDGVRIHSRDDLQGAMRGLRMSGTCAFVFDVCAAPPAAAAAAAAPAPALGSHGAASSDSAPVFRQAPSRPLYNEGRGAGAQLSAVERIRQGMGGGGAREPPVSRESSLASRPTETAAPQSGVYLTQANVDYAARDAATRVAAPAAVAPGSPREDVRVGRPSVGRPSAAAAATSAVGATRPAAAVPVPATFPLSTTGVGSGAAARPTGAAAASLNMRGMSPAPRTQATTTLAQPAVQASAAPVAAGYAGYPAAPQAVDMSGASLEKRIAALSAAVAASRDRTSGRGPN